MFKGCLIINNWIEASKSEKEIWNVINDVTNPKNNTSWCIKIGDVEHTDHKFISDSFNNYFKTKIETLKDNIDGTLIEDPMARINLQKLGKR